MLQKAQNTQKLSPNQGSLFRGAWNTLYFCVASVPAPAFWAHLIPSSQTGIISSCTPSCSMLATANREGCSKKDMPLSMKGAARKCCCCASTSTCREVRIPEGWRARQAEECKSSHRVSMLSLQTLSCYQLFKSFWGVGNLPPVHMSNSRKFSNSRDEGCQLSVFYRYYTKNLFIPAKKKPHKNQSCNHILVCPANSYFAASFPCPTTHSSSHKIAKGLRRCCFAILTFLTYAHMPSVMFCVHCPFNQTSEANSLLAVPSFRSWMIILISCHRALFTGTETGTPCISTTEVWRFGAQNWL